MKNYKEHKMNYNKPKNKLVQEDFLEYYFHGVKTKEEYVRHKKFLMKFNVRWIELMGCWGLLIISWLSLITTSKESNSR